MNSMKYLLMIALLISPLVSSAEQCNGAPNCGGDLVEIQWAMTTGSDPTDMCIRGKQILFESCGGTTMRTFSTLAFGYDYHPVSFSATAVNDLGATEQCELTVQCIDQVTAIVETEYTPVISTGTGNDIVSRGDDLIISYLGQNACSGGQYLTLRINEVSASSCLTLSSINATAVMRRISNQ